MADIGARRLESLQGHKNILSPTGTQGQQAAREQPAE